MILFFAGIIAWALLQKQKPFIPEKIIKEEKTPEQILRELTPAQPKLLTPEEQKKLTELLKQLTPAQPKPMTEKELEQLLKQLTP